MHFIKKLKNKLYLYLRIANLKQFKMKKKIGYYSKLDDKICLIFSLAAAANF